MPVSTFADRHAPTPAFHDGWKSWALGLAAAALLQITFVGQYVTWFLGALCHEMGHSAAGILTGCPSLPTIRLDGHAAAIISEQRVWLAVVVLVFFAWWFVQGRRDRWLMTARALVSGTTLLAGT